MPGIPAALLLMSNSLDNTLKRKTLGVSTGVWDPGAFLSRGYLRRLELDFSAILGGFANVEIELTWIDADRRHITVPPAAQVINIDAGDATKGSVVYLLPETFFSAIPADAAGIFLGLKGNAGTAAVSASLHCEGV